MELARTLPSQVSAPADSKVFAVVPAPATVAARHFFYRLSVETDPSDVWADLQAGDAPFVLVDCRTPEAFARAHLPGAINLPWATIADRTLEFAPGTLLITYCWSASCNAATKGAAWLSSLGCQVKEMLGGIDAWRAEGYPVEGTEVEGPLELAPAAC